MKIFAFAQLVSAVLATCATALPAFAADTHMHCADRASGVYLEVALNPAGANSYFNGSIRLYGNKLVEYFKSEGYLNEEGVHCSVYIVDQCSIQARVSSNLSAQGGGGRFEPNYRVFPDADGMKIEAYFGNNDPDATKINWFFPSCYTAP